MAKVLFFNDWHNGDVHMSRPYVTDLMTLLQGCEFYYYHPNNPKLLADIENLTHTPTKTNADIIIDTWIGQLHYKGMSATERILNEGAFLGCNFPSYYSVMGKVYENLNLVASLKPVEYYLPTINYACFDIKNIDRYFAGKKKLNVLISNNVTMSGQAPEVAFNEIVAALAGTYPDVDFLISNNDGSIATGQNVILCTDIINNPETICDLNEISYISTHCDLIVGRSSGPYTFSVVKENILSKQFVCICRSQRDSWFLEDSTNILWTNNPSADYLIQLLSNLIVKLLEDKKMDNRFYGQFFPPMDSLIKEYFIDKNMGNCIEVGAVDGVVASNTCHFERGGWDALCIEPIQPYYEMLKQNRKNALNYAIALENNDEVRFTVVILSNNDLSSVSGMQVDPRLLASHSALSPTEKQILVKSRRLDWCIENYFNHETIDFISIDTGGTELEVLKSFDVNKYNIKLLIIKNYFNDDGVGKYLNSLGWVKDKRVEVSDFYIKKTSVLVELFTLGDLYVSDFLKEGEAPRAGKVEMKLMLEEATGAVRLERSAPPDSMYGKYWYRSGINGTMKTELNDIVSSILGIVKFKENDLWIDIACNDGTLLSYVPKDFIKVGIDPADDSYKAESEKVSNLIIQDFFSADVFKRSKFGKLKAKVVTSIAMFYDLSNPKLFIDDIAEVLDQDGLWVLQLSYTPLMLDQLAFDNICHEHIYYYSLFNLKSLLNQSGFDVVDVQLNDVNGGSYRIYAMKQTANRHVFGTQPYRDVCNVRVKSLLAYEETLGLDKKSTWLDFFARITELKRELVSFITEERSKGKTIWGYGASTKGNTLLQYFGLDHSLIDGIAERSIHKFGLRTVGTNIPIYSEDEMRRAKPDYLLVLPWHFINEFISREKDYLDNGGKFIVPCPTFQVIGR